MCVCVCVCLIGNIFFKEDDLHIATMFTLEIWE